MSSRKHLDFDGQTIPIEAFSMKSMVSSPSICMIAKRGSGKSIVTQDILRHFTHYPGGIIISQTDKMSKFYGKFFPETFIYYKYTTQILEKILARQRIMVDKARKYYTKGKKCDPRIFLVMDDCLSSKGSWMKDETIAEIFYNGRHYGIMYILTMQFPLGIKPEFRSNFDYIFLLAEDFISNQKRLFDHYAGMFPDFKTFRDVFKELTKNYGCMVIVNRGAGATIFEKIYWYKADITKKIYRGDLGCKQLHNFHEDNFNKDWDKYDAQPNIDDFARKRKRGDKMNVQLMGRDD